MEDSGGEYFKKLHKPGTCCRWQATNDAIAPALRIYSASAIDWLSGKLHLPLSQTVAPAPQIRSAGAILSHRQVKLASDIKWEGATILKIFKVNV